ncbi:hypothetical protein TRVL_01273 [Trypanosoma vivax]|nr:hypothetical protein TRVL_01273 [Trypanosoma vivax]
MRLHVSEFIFCDLVPVKNIPHRMGNPVSNDWRRVPFFRKCRYPKAIFLPRGSGTPCTARLGHKGGVVWGFLILAHRSPVTKCMQFVRNDPTGHCQRSWSLQQSDAVASRSVEGACENLPSQSLGNKG